MTWKRGLVYVVLKNGLVNSEEFKEKVNKVLQNADAQQENECSIKVDFIQKNRRYPLKRKSPNCASDQQKSAPIILSLSERNNFFHFQAFWDLILSLIL